MIKHLLKSSEFLIRMKAGQHRSSRHKRHIRLSNGKRIPLNIYIPKHTRPCGTVVFMHGMNHQGHLDKRVINLCHTLADCGYQVVSPHFDDIAHYWIDPKQIDDISLTLEAIASEPILAHNGKITVFSISFTGTLALAASGREVCRDAVESIMLLGSFYKARDFLEHVLSNDCTQAYPKMIALRNLMHALEDHDPRIIQALECAIDDNANGIAMEDTASTLQAYLKNTNDPELNQHVQTLLESLENTEPYKKSLAKQIEQIHRQFYEALDFSEVKGNVVLVHGADDNTIVAQSSLDLHAHLQKQNIESTVLITPLIESHSSYKPSLKSAWDFVQLTQTIGSFFKKTG